MLRQPYDLDAILIGDVREGREAAEMLLAAGTVLARRGHSVGIVPLADHKDRTGVVLPGLAAAVRRGSLILIEESEQRHWCRLAIVAGAPLLAGAAASLPPITARQALVLVTETVLDRQGKPRFDLSATAGLVSTQIATEQHWCPADPYIRRQLQEAGLTALLHPEDWPPALDVPAWRLPRAAPAGRRAVLGHAVGRGIDPLGPDRASILKRYPAGEGLPLRLHGAEDELLKALDPLPAGWQIVPPAMAGARRFLARLDFFLLQPERIPARPPRALLEAMAVGRVALLAPGFRALLGEGLAYRTPEQMTPTVRYLHAEPAFYDRYLAAQDKALERYTLDALQSRLLPFLEPARAPRPAAVGADRRRIAFYPTNGIGLGHVARLLAVAKRLGPAHEPVFFTPCHALAVIEHAGYRTEYVSEPAYDETLPADHARAMAPTLANAFRHHGVEAVVFDGNVPRDALVMAAAECGLPFVWVRRGMWRADPSLARFLELSRHADAVIEPMEAAASADAGVTASAEDGPIRIPPVFMLDRHELLPRAKARAALRVPAQGLCALVQLGSGNNRDVEELLDPIIAAAQRLGIELLASEWLISNNPIRRRNLRYLSAFPTARYLNAFDFAISAAGYNSFHELLHHGLPCIFLPNDDQRVDDQRARAAFADREGAGICVPRGSERQIGRYMELLQDRSARRLIGRRAREICPANGGGIAAATIQTVLGCR